MAGHPYYTLNYLFSDWSKVYSEFSKSAPVMTELKNDCPCVTGDPVGDRRRGSWRENIELSNTFRMKDPRVS